MPEQGGPQRVRALVVRHLGVRGGGGRNGPLGRERGGAGSGRGVVVLHGEAQDKKGSKQAGRRDVNKLDTRERYVGSWAMNGRRGCVP